jgi:ssDNA thymidine ADP-ribosyltransferase, DarT
MPAPQPTRLFHISAIANLQAICAAGKLLSKNCGAAAGINYQNIAYSGAQNARAARTVPNPPGGSIHDYVPFYFAPRSPMLFTINRGNVPGCQWRQADIVHFETTVQRVTGSGGAYLFYDRNATLQYSQAYTSLVHLDAAVSWDLLLEVPTLDGFCKYWHDNAANPRYADRMERRQAEFLVKTSVPLNYVTRLGVIDENSKAQVEGILRGAGIALRVDVMREWYF